MDGSSPKKPRVDATSTASTSATAQEDTMEEGFVVVDDLSSDSTNETADNASRLRTLPIPPVRTYDSLVKECERTIINILTYCIIDEFADVSSQKLLYLKALRGMLKVNVVEPLMDYSVELMFILTDNLQRSDSTIQKLVLEILLSAFKTREMFLFWSASLGLILHSIIVAIARNREDSDVSTRARDAFSAVLRSPVGDDVVISNLITLIAEERYSYSEYAIDLLDMVMQQPAFVITEQRLRKIMYVLRAAYGSDWNSLNSSALKQKAIYSMTTACLKDPVKFQRVHPLVPDEAAELFTKYRLQRTTE